jgi:RecJ-like exonuclease
MIAIEGLISRVRFFHGKKEYTLTDGNIEHQLKSDESIPQGAAVAVEGEMAVGGVVARKVVILEGEKARKVFEKAKDAIARSSSVPDAPSLLDDDIVKKIWPRLRYAAVELLCAKKLGRSVLMRFHGDADGICGAFALTSVIYCKAFQQNSAVYGVKDALRDISAIGQENRPLVVLLDFGSGDSSIEGLNRLTAAGIGYLVIDHHPYNHKENEKIINPISADESASKYTAGYLACEVATACGLEREKALELAKTSCAGDKSDIIGNGEADAKRAMVLDFLASHVSFGNNLDFYRNVMMKAELFDSIAVQADESIEDAAGKAMARMKVTETTPKPETENRKLEAGNHAAEAASPQARRAEGRLRIAVFSLENIVKRGEWPPSSKVTTRIFDKLKGEGPLLCIGHTDRTIIMRLNDGAVEMGLDANGLAEKMKTSMGDFVEGGGGHVRAGAIRAKAGFVKDVLNQLLGEAAGLAK